MSIAPRKEPKSENGEAEALVATNGDGPEGDDLEAVSNASRTHNLAKSEAVHGKQPGPRDRKLTQLIGTLDALSADEDFKRIDLAYRFVISEIVRRYFDVEGRGWFYQETLAAELGVSTKTVERAVKRARELGILFVQRQHWADSGRRTNNRYQLAERFVLTDKRHVSRLALTTFESVGTTDTRVGAEAVQLEEAEQLQDSETTTLTYRTNLGREKGVFESVESPSLSSPTNALRPEQNNAHALTTLESVSEVERAADNAAWRNQYLASLSPEQRLELERKRDRLRRFAAEIERDDDDYDEDYA